MTAKARLIELLTSKNYDNIYRKVRQPFKLSNKELAKDLKYIRKYFEDLGLTEIVKMIDNELFQNRIEYSNQ